MPVYKIQAIVVLPWVEIMNLQHPSEVYDVVVAMNP
jgi:hypothetical protein